jgi:radical SAM/Cys-rich protein
MLLDRVSRFQSHLDRHRVRLTRQRPEILQLNLGKLCNLTCVHCHVNAGPKRKEIITRETLERIVAWLAPLDLPKVDLTGGAPEMVPDFRWLVAELKRQGRHIIDRCNLTILLEPGYEGLAEFLRDHSVEIVASMPCYSPANVNAQRGDGVFDASIAALRRLNALGYGLRDDLPLHLVYNPVGAFLPGDQVELEADYRRELAAHFDLHFHRLYTITNMPIARFAAWLRHEGRLEEYMRTLIAAFNPASVERLMCRNTISVGWRGEVYDCDFNQQLGLQVAHDGPLFVWDLAPATFAERVIRVGDHCFGCTAGAGSSCGGALV